METSASEGLVWNRITSICCRSSDGTSRCRKRLRPISWTWGPDRGGTSGHVRFQLDGLTHTPARQIVLNVEFRMRLVSLDHSYSLQGPCIIQHQLLTLSHLKEKEKKLPKPRREEPRRQAQNKVSRKHREEFETVGL